MNAANRSSQRRKLLDSPLTRLAHHFALPQPHAVDLHAPLRIQLRRRLNVKRLHVLQLHRPALLLTPHIFPQLRLAALVSARPDLSLLSRVVRQPEVLLQQLERGELQLLRIALTTPPCPPSIFNPY